MASKQESDVQIPDDIIEKSNSTILFTGAGFSKDAGYLLANELWHYIYNSPDLSQDLRDVMQESSHQNYEELYEAIKDNKAQFKTLTDIILKVFKLMDDAHISDTYPNNELSMFKLIELFKKDNYCNYIFTVNQDLLLERFFLEKHAIIYNDIIKSLHNKPENVDELENSLSLYFPFIDYSLRDAILRHANSKKYVGKLPYKYEILVKTIKLEHNKIPKVNMYNYVKLHGSANWHHSDGYVINLTGQAKSAEISQSKLLNPGFDLFKEVTCRVNSKILIVGYSFSDKHINDVFLDSIENGCQLAIINPSHWVDFKRNIHNILGDDKSPQLIKAIARYYPFTLMEFLNETKYSEVQYNNLEQFLDS